MPSRHRSKSFEGSICVIQDRMQAARMAPSNYSFQSGTHVELSAALLISAIVRSSLCDRCFTIGCEFCDCDLNFIENKYSFVYDRDLTWMIVIGIV